MVERAESGSSCVASSDDCQDPRLSCLRSREGQDDARDRLNRCAQGGGATSSSGVRRTEAAVPPEGDGGGVQWCSSSQITGRGDLETEKHQTPHESANSCGEPQEVRVQSSSRSRSAARRRRGGTSLLHRQEERQGRWDRTTNDTSFPPHDTDVSTAVSGGVGGISPGILPAGEPSPGRSPAYWKSPAISPGRGGKRSGGGGKWRGKRWRPYDQMSLAEKRATLEKESKAEKEFQEAGAGWCIAPLNTSSYILGNTGASELDRELFFRQSPPADAKAGSMLEDVDPDEVLGLLQGADVVPAVRPATGSDNPAGTPGTGVEASAEAAEAASFTPLLETIPEAATDGKNRTLNSAGGHEGALAAGTQRLAELQRCFTENLRRIATLQQRCRDAGVSDALPIRREQNGGLGYGLPTATVVDASTAAASGAFAGSSRALP